MIAGRPPVPAEDQRALGGAGSRTRGSTIAPGFVTGAWPPCAIRTVSSSSAMTISRSPVASTRVHRRVQSAPPPSGGHDADHGRVLEREQRLAEGAAHEHRLVREVDLVAAEVEQLGVDHRQARLAAGLRDDPRDQLADQHQLGLVAADHARDLQVRAGRGSRRRCGTARRRRRGLLVIASRVLMTSASGSSVSGESTMIERDVLGLAISRSSRSIGLPVRQTTRVRPVWATWARISSSISTLSRSARMTIAPPPAGSRWRSRAPR